MGQEFLAVVCCGCSTYQVQQVKKTPKWVCKICQQKQSLKKAFAQGNAKDCRFAVQELNMKRGLVESTKMQGMISHYEAEEAICLATPSRHPNLSTSQPIPSSSLWDEYLSLSDETGPESESLFEREVSPNINGENLTKSKRPRNKVSAPRPRKRANMESPTSNLQVQAPCTTQHGNRENKASYTVVPTAKVDSVLGTKSLWTQYLDSGSDSAESNW